MKAKNLLPENYAAQCVKNWSKKESKFNDLTKIEKISVLESMYKVDKDETLTFPENVEFKKLTKDEIISYISNPVNRDKDIKGDTIVERLVSTTYDKVTLLAKIKYLLTKVESPEKLIIPIGIERVKAIYSFMQSFDNVDALLQFIESEKDNEEEEEEETETETETAPQK